MAVPHTGRSQHGLSLQTHRAGLRSGNVQINRGKVSSGYHELPQDVPARAEHPQNHCWEPLCLTPTLFLLLFGPVHRHPRESPSVHEHHPPAEPQEGFQPQLRVPVSPAGFPPPERPGWIWDRSVNVPVPSRECKSGAGLWEVLQLDRSYDLDEHLKTPKVRAGSSQSCRQRQGDARAVLGLLGALQNPLCDPHSTLLISKNAWATSRRTWETCGSSAARAGRTWRPLPAAEWTRWTTGASRRR